MCILLGPDRSSVPQRIIRRRPHFTTKFLGILMLGCVVAGICLPRCVLARIIPAVAGAVEMLECEFAALVDAPGAVATGFGRSALHLALLEAEVRGGEVLVPDFICAQVPEAVRRAGADIVFYPVSRDLGVDPAGFEAAFTNRTRAAVAAQYFRRVLSEIRPLAAICRRRGVPLIEDGALALGAPLDGRACGSFGELAAFSFTKSDWCYGGGMVIAREEGRLARLRALRGRSLHRRATLAWRYGLLRRADFAANRPAMSRAAERAGRWLERLAGAGGDNFYDAGRFDAALPGF